MERDGVDIEPTAAITVPARDVLRLRPVAALLTSQLCFTCATAIQAIAIGKQVYDITGEELDLGLVGLVEFLPTFLLVLVTGLVADRFDKRLVAAAALGLELAVSLGLALYAATEPTAVGPIFGLAAGFGVARAFHSPSERAMKPLVAEPQHLPRVVALHSSTWQIGAIVGPVASGFLYAWTPVAPFVAAAVLSGGAIVAMLAVTYVRPVEPLRDRPTFATATAGLALIRRTPVLLGVISLDLFAVLFGGAVALLPAIADQRLGVDDAVGLGFLRAAVGLGAASAALVLAARPLQRHVGRWLLYAVGVFGVLTIVLGVTDSFVVAFVALAGLSAADMVSVFVRATLVPLATRADALGRVHAVEQVFIGASNELGAFESGVAAAAIGTGAAVILGGAATLIVVVVWGLVFPSIRRIDSFDEISVW